MPERPPHACPAWPARTYHDEARANVAVARKPAGAVEAYLCDPDNPAGHWHIRGITAREGRHRQLRDLVLAQLREHGRVDRAQLREIAADVYGARKRRAGGGRQSTDMLRRVIVELETAGVLVRSETEIVAVDEAALQAS